MPQGIDLVDETLKKWRSEPFVWGFNDCLISIANYVLQITGIDHAAKFRGQYSDKKTANEFIKKSGGEIALINSTGLEEQFNMNLFRGYIVLCQMLDQKHTGICTGQAVAFKMTSGTVELDVRFLKILNVWKV